MAHYGGYQQGGMPPQPPQPGYPYTQPFPHQGQTYAQGPPYPPQQPGIWPNSAPGPGWGAPHPPRPSFSGPPAVAQHHPQPNFPVRQHQQPYPAHHQGAGAPPWQAPGPPPHPYALPAPQAGGFPSDPTPPQLAYPPPVGLPGQQPQHAPHHGHVQNGWAQHPWTMPAPPTPHLAPPAQFSTAPPPLPVQPPLPSQPREESPPPLPASPPPPTPEVPASPPRPPPAPLQPSFEQLRPIVDLATLLRPPGRASRPARLLLLLRGLPGSGKSYLARCIRDVEVQEGGDAPRVHSLDEYFMQEVEREVQEEGGRGRPRKRIVTELQYVYDADMEESYRRSLCKAVARTLGEGRFGVVVMDAPNLAVHEFADVLPAAERAGYSVYAVRPLETDPALCAARGLHGHSAEHVASLAARLEPAPMAVTLADARRLLQAKLQGSSPIDEVDMEDAEAAGQGTSDPRGGVDGHPSVAHTVVTRWQAAEDGADMDEAGNAGAAAFPPPSRKRARPGSPDPRLGGAPAEQGPMRGEVGTGALRPSLLYARPRVRKGVTWRDQPSVAALDAGDGHQVGMGAEEGFRIQPSAQPLCEVHVLEDLGPARGDTAVQYMDATSPLLAAQCNSSFADQVRAEHEEEHHLLAGPHHVEDPGLEEDGFLSQEE